MIWLIILYLVLGIFALKIFSKFKLINRYTGAEGILLYYILWIFIMALGAISIILHNFAILLNRITFGKE